MAEQRSDPERSEGKASATKVSTQRSDAVAAEEIAAEVAGLDALDQAESSHESNEWLRKAWRATWPKLAAVAIALGVWQLVAASGWKPDYALPGPMPALTTLWELLGTGEFWQSVATTMQRGVIGFAIASVGGLALGTAVSRIPLLRTAIGSLITGLQTMPSIAWFPLAVVLFGAEEGAILFVILLGAAPSIANGVISGIDYVEPVLLKAAANLGARGWRLYAFVVLPASLPSIVAGLKQGWAFAWRSLMAGELIVFIAERPSLGGQLDLARTFSRSDLLLAFMIVILIIGIAVDALFNVVNRAIRRRWGVLDAGL